VTKRESKDAFAAEYMEAGGDVRHRDKRVSRWMAAILMVPAVFVLGLSAFIASTNATASKPVPEAALPFVIAGMIAFALMYVLLSLSFAVLRTVVTAEDVVVKYGLWGPRIPLERIRSCKVKPYEWTKFGGFGIRLGKGGVWAYVPGPGPVVEITYDDGGKEKVVQIGASDARLLAQQIDDARAALGGPRIGADDDAEAEAEREAIAEAEGKAEERELHR
jgi:hypothetical protein